jgi:predicted transcriptional regulator
MLALEGATMIHATDDPDFRRKRGAVAKILLENAMTDSGERPRLAQRDIATMTGVDWYTVHVSLKSIRDEGAIRMERDRIIVNKESLKRLAGEAGGA